MKYPSFKLVFDRKKRASKINDALVQLEVTYDRNRYYFSTNVKVFKHEWHPTLKVINREDREFLNERIDILYNWVNEYINLIIKEKVEFEKSHLENFIKIKHLTNGSDNFLSFMSKQIEVRNNRSTTKVNHISCLRRLEKFGLIQKFSDLTSPNIKLFDDWLKSQKYEQATIHNTHKRIKSYINDAISLEIIKLSPYGRFNIPRGNREKRVYLTEQEVQSIANLELDHKPSIRARDCFLFCCYTGLAYADLKAFDFKKDVYEKNGRYILEGERVKTGKEYKIMLLPPTIEILEKYDWVLPVPTKDYYNRLLRLIGLLAGIKKPVTSHVARHTFATWALANNVPIQVVSKMLAHSKLETTLIYAKVLQEQVIDNYTMLADKFNKVG